MTSIGLTHTTCNPEKIANTWYSSLCSRQILHVLGFGRPSQWNSNWWTNSGLETNICYFSHFILFHITAVFSSLLFPQLALPALAVSRLMEAFFWKKQAVLPSIWRWKTFVIFMYKEIRSYDKYRSKVLFVPRSQIHLWNSSEQEKRVGMWKKMSALNISSWNARSYSVIFLLELFIPTGGGLFKKEMGQTGKEGI